MIEKNLFLPGNLRYQPKDLEEFFAYDNLYSWIVRVEIATLEVLGEIGVIPSSDLVELNPNLKEKLLSIVTTDVDKIEKEVTKHDVRALIQKMQSMMSLSLGRWVHVPLTSYDPIESARAIQFTMAFQLVTRPAVVKVIDCLISMVNENFEVLQIGRTHGQHALPITVGFWLASILDRVVRNLEMMDICVSQIVGKISGPVGAHNAQIGMDLPTLCGDKSFEERIHEKLGIKTARISTQILPPEPLAYFLFSYTMMSGALAQLGRDCRQLMRSEIGEIKEQFQSGQVGSSTMAHKRNPINFENTEGMFIRTKNEFGKVMDTLISEHQRDLVGSCVARDFPIIVINLQQQLNTLLRSAPGGKPFILRISIDKESCKRNFSQNSKLILAEPIYIALQMAGYRSDAHHLVNHTLVPLATKKNISLAEALMELAEENEELSCAIKGIPKKLIELFYKPELYIGDAKERSLKIACYAKNIITR